MCVGSEMGVEETKAEGTEDGALAMPASWPQLYPGVEQDLLVRGACQR